MTGLAFIAGIAVLFAMIALLEGAGRGQAFAVRPAGLLQWLSRGNWPAKVGGALLLISTGALLRYLMLMIDVPASAKLGAGICVGAVLGGLSAALRHQARLRAVHLALGGAALGVAYLTAYSAYGFFHFIHSVQALGLLFVVACVGGAFALLSRAQSMAILAMAGAFMAPAFALAAPTVLAVYGYYCLVSALVLLMVALRGWRPLIHLSFLFTLAGALFFGWTQKFYGPAYFAPMHPLLLGLVALHLLMPVLELRAAALDEGAWRRRFDHAYFVLLPLVSAVLMLLLAPDDAVEGALGMLELGLLWAAAAGLQQWRAGTGAVRYGAVALVLGVVAALLAFRDAPYFLIAASVSCVLLAASRVLRLSEAAFTALAVAALAFSAFHIMQSLLEPVMLPPFLNRAYLYSIILTAVLLLAAQGARAQHSQRFAPVCGVLALAWFVLASARELIVLDLAYLPQLSHLLALSASAAYAMWVMRRPPAMAVVLLLAFAMYLSGMFCARLLPTGLLFAAMLAGQLVFLAIAHAAGRHPQAGGEAVAGIARSVLPVLIFPFAVAYSAGVEASRIAVVMTYLVSSALVASLHAQLTMPAGRFWPNTLSPVGFVLFGLWLFYQTLCHIERDAWAVAYELMALLYIGLTAQSLQHPANRDARFFGLVAVLALLTTSAAMFLRAFGPPGTLSILAISQMLLPTVVSLLWAIAGALLTWWATRSQSRRLWALGALLLVAAAIKLVLFDFGSLGQLGNILAMMAAGCVFMAVAWLAPLPPRREAPAAASTAAHAAVAEAADEAQRAWLWVLAGLVVLFFFYHSVGGRSAKPRQAAVAQTWISLADIERMATSSAPAAPTTPSAPRAGDPLAPACARFVAQLPEHYVVHAVLAPDAAPTSTVAVQVNNPGQNIVLILAAHAPLTWQILPVNGGRIVGVVLPGPQPGALEGLFHTVPVLRSAQTDAPACAGLELAADEAGLQRLGSKLLGRSVDDVRVPRQGRVELGG